MARAMRGWWWAAYLAAGLGLAAVYAFVTGEAPRSGVMVLACLATIMASAAGPRLWRVRALLAHNLVAGGLAVGLAAGLASQLWPGRQDLILALWVGCYGLAATACLCWIRASGPHRDRAALLDATVVALGAGMLAWVFLIAPYAHAAGLALVERLRSVSDPVLDVLMLGMVTRLLLVRPRSDRSMAYHLLVWGWLVMIAVDAVRGVLILRGVFDPNSALDAGWLVPWAMWGACSLHPSVASLTTASTVAPARLTGGRLALLAGASLMAPAVLAVQWSRGGPIDVPVIVAGCVALFLLVLLRVADLVRQVEARVDDLRAAEAVLRGALAERDALAARLHHQAYHDPLTGLANRALFDERLAGALVDERLAPVAVLLVDLDDFKAVNDGLGHAAGDELLLVLAGRLRDALPASATVARLGGDEFAAVLTGVEPDELPELARAVVGAIGLPVELVAGPAVAGASVGAALAAPGVAAEPGALLRAADLAMYAAKARGKGTYELAPASPRAVAQATSSTQSL